MLRPPLKAPRRVMMTVDAVGGVWRYAADLGRSLSLQGTDVLFVGLGPAPSPTQLAEIAVIPRLSFRWTKLPLDWLVQRECELLSIPDVLAHIADEECVDLIHLNLPTQAVGLVASCPVVVATHSCLSTWWRAVRREALPEHLDWHRRRTAAGLNAADVVITPSESHATAMRDVYGELPDIKVVHNGSAAAVIPRAPAEFVFSAGRWWDPAKNLRVLDLAAERLRWPVLIAGDLSGPDGKVEQPTNVRHLGRLSRVDMERVLAGAQVFVSPALYEPFGLSVLEAAQAGTALVLSDIPTFRELWDEAALFVDATDPDELGQALNRLATDRSERDRLAQAAHQRASRYTLEAQVAAMFAAYDQAGLQHRSVLAATG